jgi:uncharacterized protein (TIRG00374 family)
MVLKFVNVLTPSRFAGRSAGPLIIKYFTELSWEDSVAVIAVQTMLYAGLYGVATLIGIATVYDKMSLEMLFVATLSMILYIAITFMIILVVLYIDRIQSAVERFIVPYLPTTVTDRISVDSDDISKFSDVSSKSFVDISNNKRVLAKYAIGWAGSMMLFPAMRVALLLPELPDDVSVWILPLLLIVGYSVTLLPLTPGGIGVAEVTTTLVFVSLGFSESIIITVILIDRFLTSYLASIFGWGFAINVDV